MSERAIDTCKTQVPKKVLCLMMSYVSLFPKLAKDHFQTLSFIFAPLLILNCDASGLYSSNGKAMIPVQTWKGISLPTSIRRMFVWEASNSDVAQHPSLSTLRRRARPLQNGRSPGVGPVQLWQAFSIAFSLKPKNLKKHDVWRFWINPGGKIRYNDWIEVMLTDTDWGKPFMQPRKWAIG